MDVSDINISLPVATVVDKSALADQNNSLAVEISDEEEEDNISADRLYVEESDDETNVSIKMEVCAFDRAQVAQSYVRKRRVPAELRTICCGKCAR